MILGAVRPGSGSQRCNSECNLCCEASRLPLSQNAYIERFNRTYRDEVLNVYLFENLEQVREITADWLITYNERRPHDACDDLPPTVFRERQTAKNSTFELST